ncbi:AAA family ATPase [Nonomuraea sp. NPDC026600]|uniref:AAA family ATPase n=1 Tax=Nonomuraea sp. NPDC026600 TaxID=3155363 RepID=UPI0033C6358C
MTQDSTRQDSAALRADLNAVIGEVAAIYHERDTEARMITVGVLAQQHTLLLGPPGTGKSAIVRELTGRIESGRYWEILLSKFTAPTAIFGPIDVGALAQGTYRQILDGHATTAHVAFLDEIFKCSAAALNSMLAYLNERIYHPESGGAPISCPLVSAVCASNELGEDEATAALYDRLLIRMEVDYLAEADSFDRLLMSAVTGGGQAPTRTTVELTGLLQVAAHEIPAVDLPAPVREAIRDVRSDLRQREITSSDRRWKQAVRVLQAAAWLEGRAAVAVDDLAVLTHVLWDVPSNKSTVSRVIRGYLSPDDRDLANLEDQVDRIAAELDKLIADGDEDELRTWAVNRNVELAQVAKRISAIRDVASRGGRALAPYQQAADRAQQVYTRLLSEALGVAPDKIPALGRRR